MGSLGKALKRVDYFKRLGEKLQRISDENDRETEMQDFLGAMDKAQKKNRDRYYEQEFYDKQPEQPNPMQDNLPRGDAYPQMEGYSGDMQGPKNRGEELGSLQGPMNEVPVTDPGQLREAGREGQRDIMGLFKKGLGYEQLAPGKVNAGMSMLQQLLQLREPPKYTTEHFGSDQTEVTRNEFGEEVSRKEGLSKDKTEEYEIDENGEYKIYKIKGQDYYKKIKRNSAGKQIGETITRVPKPGEGSSTVNVFTPTDYSGLQRDLTTSTEDYQFYQDVVTKNFTKIEKLRGEVKALGNDDDNKDMREAKLNEIQELQTEMDEAQENKDATFGDIKGVTDAIANKLNSDHPGFEGIYNLLYQLIEDPKDINMMVDQEMEGAPADLKIKMKELLKSRIFKKNIGKR